jgi:hypothetical protein
MTTELRTRLLEAFLMSLGIVWFLLALWVLVIMSGISTPAIEVWLLLLMYFGPPVALVAGSALIMARRWTRIGLLLAFLVCAWLTWIIGSDLWRRKPENNAIAPMHYDWISAALVLIVLAADTAFVLVWRNLRAASPKIDI